MHACVQKKQKKAFGGKKNNIYKHIIIRKTERVISSAKPISAQQNRIHANNINT